MFAKKIKNSTLQFLQNIKEKTNSVQEYRNSLIQKQIETQNLLENLYSYKIMDQLKEFMNKKLELEILICSQYIIKLKNWTSINKISMIINKIKLPSVFTKEMRIYIFILEVSKEVKIKLMNHYQNIIEYQLPHDNSEEEKFQQLINF